MNQFLNINGQACFFWALLLFAVPLRWLLAACLAAFVHELFHAVSIYLLGGRICSMEFGSSGIRMNVCDLDRRGEFFAALSGPLGSFILVSFGRIFPLSAVCGFVQGIFNLIPVYPLDGGRALKCVLDALFPMYSQKILHTVSACTVVFLFFLSALLSWKLVIIPVLLLVHSDILRKRP